MAVSQPGNVDGTAPEPAREAPVAGAGDRAARPTHLDPAFLDDVDDLVDGSADAVNLDLAIDARAAVPLPRPLEGIADVRRQCRRSRHERRDWD